MYYELLRSEESIEHCRKVRQHQSNSSTEGSAGQQDDFEFDHLSSTLQQQQL